MRWHLTVTSLTNINGKTFIVEGNAKICIDAIVGDSDSIP
jgi:hypothetical protein